MSRFKLEHLKEDNRGEHALLLFGKFEAFISHTKKGMSRGGYYFKQNKNLPSSPPRIYLVLNGRMTYSEKNMNNGEEIVKEIKIGDYFELKPNRAHMFTAIEDTDMIEFTPGATGKTEMIPYAPYRKIVEKDIV